MSFIEVKSLNPVHLCSNHPSKTEESSICKSYRSNLFSFSAVGLNLWLWVCTSHTGAGLALSGDHVPYGWEGPTRALCPPTHTHTHSSEPLWLQVGSYDSVWKDEVMSVVFNNNKVWIKTNRFIFYWWSILFIIRVFVVNIHTKSFLSGGSEKQEVESITFSTASPAPLLFFLLDQ